MIFSQRLQIKINLLHRNFENEYKFFFFLTQQHGKRKTGFIHILKSFFSSLFLCKIILEHQKRKQPINPAPMPKKLKHSFILKQKKISYFHRIIPTQHIPYKNKIVFVFFLNLHQFNYQQLYMCLFNCLFKFLSFFMSVCLVISM